MSYAKVVLSLVIAISVGAVGGWKVRDINVTSEVNVYEARISDLEKEKASDDEKIAQYEKYLSTLTGIAVDNNNFLKELEKQMKEAKIQHDKAWTPLKRKEGTGDGDKGLSRF